MTQSWGVRVDYLVITLAAVVFVALLLYTLPPFPIVSRW